MTIAILLTFILGYILIAIEHKTQINKAAIALVTGALCWTIYAVNFTESETVLHQLNEHLGSIAEILFFLLGAMTIVEMIDAHDGFQLVSEKVRTTNQVRLLWLISFITFFLSAILDNLTTTIVVISILRKIVPAIEKRMFYVGIVIIAANAGGAWSPIGDVTTTMLWIGKQITAVNIIIKTFLPSLFCLLIPLLFATVRLKKEKNLDPVIVSENLSNTTLFERNFTFFLGLSILILIPVFKTMTHLPPYIGMLFGLGILWIASEIIHKGKSSEDKEPLSVVFALRKIDTPSILFFLGILLSISVLESIGELAKMAAALKSSLANDSLTVIIIGLLSAVVDNVPLVAAAQGMFSLTDYPTDHFFWEFLAYTTGTGGSALIIGSAAGVTAMGMENVDFFWYLKKISWLALLGYFSGALVYIAQNSLL